MRVIVVSLAVLLISNQMYADCTATPNAWCQTFPGTLTLPAVPPYGRAWNNLIWNPEVHKAMIWVTDAGQVTTFSNAWYGYAPQYPNVATDLNAWTKYSSCGTVHGAPPGEGASHSSFLGTAISATETTVTARTDFPLTLWEPSGFIWIGDEEMAYSAKSGLAFTIRARGVRGTTAASHPACVGTPGTSGCDPSVSRLMAGCPAPVNGVGTPINDHPTERHPAVVSAYRSGQIWQAGGYQEVGTPSDTWHWDSINNWVFVPGANTPHGHDDAMAYHADKDVLIKYGGDAGNGSLTSIYCFAINASLGCTATNTWIKLTATNLDKSTGHVAPSRYKHIMIYEPANKQILMVGGANSGAPTADAQLWSISYNSSISKWQWTQKASLPYAQQRSPVTFDSHIGKVVLFTAANNSQNGGNGISPGETWLYDPVLDSWTQTGVTGPLINTFAIAQHMTFNPENNVLIMDKQSTPGTIEVYELSDSALGAPAPTRLTSPTN